MHRFYSDLFKSAGDSVLPPLARRLLLRFTNKIVTATQREELERNFCLNKIGKRISGWSNHLLSFTGKVILIQHVLHSITIYHMMYMATPIATVDQINWLFTDFLWGFDSKSGKQKTPLVTWKCLTQPREKGGHGFKDYMAHVEALLSRWISHSIEDPQLEWTESFMGLMKDFTWDHKRS